MESVFKLLIIGGTVSLVMYFAYLSSKVKAGVAGRDQQRDDDAPGREEFEQLQAHVQELAERVDFAERMLAQRRDAERLEEPRP
jgi:uncharacterized protein YlxW (UPF0749 family)